MDTIAFRVINIAMIRKVLVSSLLTLTLANVNAALADAYYPAVKSVKRQSAVVTPVSSVNEADIDDLQQQINDLDARLKTTSSESVSVRQDLERQIATLRQSIDSLRTQGMGTQSDISSLNAKVAALIAENEKKKTDINFQQLVSPVFTAPVGTVMGAVRGAASKSTDHTKDFYDALGGGVWGTVAAPVGFLSGAVSGLVSGTAKGFVDGVVVGVEEPFSLRSISMDGKYLDFDSYDIF